MGDRVARERLDIVAGTPPGGGQDRTARALASMMGSIANVMNVPGRGGGNAWDLLADRQGETRIVAVSSPTLITNRLLGDSTIDDRDLCPIATLYTEYGVVVAPTGSTWLAPGDLLTGIADGAVTVSFATALGNINHLALVEVGRQVGAEVETMALRVFDSARLAVADLLEGSSDVALVSAASATTELAEGALEAVAVVAPGRLGGLMAAVPTLRELGVDCDLGMWRGLIGPPATPKTVIERWTDRLAVARATREWATLLEENHWTETFLGPVQTELFLEDQRQLLSTLTQAAGLTEVVGSG